MNTSIQTKNKFEELTEEEDEPELEPAQSGQEPTGHGPSRVQLPPLSTGGDVPPSALGIREALRVEAAAKQLALREKQLDKLSQYRDEFQLEWPDHGIKYDSILDSDVPMFTKDPTIFEIQRALHCKAVGSGGYLPKPSILHPHMYSPKIHEPQ